MEIKIIKDAINKKELIAAGVKNKMGV